MPATWWAFTKSLSWCRPTRVPVTVFRWLLRSWSTATWCSGTDLLSPFSNCQGGRPPAPASPFSLQGRSSDLPFFMMVRQHEGSSRKTETEPRKYPARTAAPSRCCRAGTAAGSLRVAAPHFAAAGPGAGGPACLFQFLSHRVRVRQQCPDEGHSHPGADVRECRSHLEPGILV